MEKKHVLVVDDVSTNLRCIGEILKDYYKISMAKSGEAALTFLAEQKPFLIILDVFMPNLDGYQTMELIKERGLSEIPVIFLSADSEIATEEKGLQMGAVDFIRKPFEPNRVLECVQKVLEA